MITVETRFPTGNGQVRSLGGGGLVTDRDLRNSTGDRWYWHVRLRAPADTVVAARHHACEAMASFVLEGAVRQFVADVQKRRRPARPCELIVVPTRQAAVALDFHTPGLRGPLEERPYVVASGDADDAEKAQQLLDTLPADPVHGADAPALLVFDEDWNSVRSTGQRCFAAYVRSLNHANTAFSIEYPNAGLRGTAVTPDRARSFGATILHALLSLLW